jgi:hypothetical protein
MLKKIAIPLSSPSARHDPKTASAHTAASDPAIQFQTARVIVLRMVRAWMSRK